jgi:hypothetical protein
MAAGRPAYAGGRRFTLQWTRDGETVANIAVRVEAGCVFLSYRYQRNGGEWEDIDEPVALDTTACNYGGHRYWYRCPAVGCGQRAVILYGAGRYFACRLCYRLVYESQREATDDRAARRADKIRARLGWEPGILNGNGWKPKGMHWRTFERLTARHDELVGKSLADMARRLGLAKGG